MQTQFLQIKIILTVQTVSHLVSLEVCKDVWRHVCITQSQYLSLFPLLVSGSLSLSPPPALTFPLSFHLSHISISFCFSYLLRPSLALPVLQRACCSCLLSQMFFFTLFPSHYPLLFCTHFIFHLNTFSPLSRTHASPSRSDGSGSLSPPPPTYHRVYYICHHLLLP